MYQAYHYLYYCCTTIYTVLSILTPVVYLNLAPNGVLRYCVLLLCPVSRVAYFTLQGSSFEDSLRWIATLKAAINNSPPDDTDPLLAEALRLEDTFYYVRRSLVELYCVPLPLPPPFPPPGMTRAMAVSGWCIHVLDFVSRALTCGMRCMHFVAEYHHALFFVS